LIYAEMYQKEKAKKLKPKLPRILHKRIRHMNLPCNIEVMNSDTNMNPRGKARPGCDADHSHPSSAEVRNE
jgi:hypothetical protein